MGKLTISMAIFNSYFDITRGYIPLNPIKSHDIVDYPMKQKTCVLLPLDTVADFSERPGRCALRQ